jgi:LuxR family maltose regulon positive regulatory protein
LGSSSIVHSTLERSNALIEPLSERELQVLRLVASGLSDRAIAEKLVLATGTVKKHLNNIYGKLAVHTRTQALARVRELDVLLLTALSSSTCDKINRSLRLPIRDVSSVCG